eukprot:TRINITY_DN7480_c0_g1_i1.p1 TRINITY_DN7480_c0_g1~~TRINITY_DN7480_c0_g1_i1.p1  ORF type:complete len:169 (-),score=26.78 TRINITY_DN7480_c0_g1_i1:125-631(-)
MQIWVEYGQEKASVNVDESITVDRLKEILFSGNAISFPPSVSRSDISIRHKEAMHPFSPRSTLRSFNIRTGDILVVSIINNKVLSCCDNNENNSEQKAERSPPELKVTKQRKRKRTPWTEAEHDKMMEAYSLVKPQRFKDWKHVAPHVGTKTALQCYLRHRYFSVQKV